MFLSLLETSALQLASQRVFYQLVNIDLLRLPLHRLVKSNKKEGKGSDFSEQQLLSGAPTTRRLFQEQPMTPGPPLVHFTARLARMKLAEVKIITTGL